MNWSQYIWIFSGILLPNVALRGKAVQSSTRDSALGAADNAIDGKRYPDVQSGSCSITNEESSPWWRVDLQHVYHITAVMITNRNGNPNRLDGGEIRIGNSLENNGNSNSRCAVISQIPSGRTYSFQCNYMAGRYVNVFLPGKKKVLSLCEVEVYTTQYAPVLPNVAVRRHATQSSTLSFSTAAKAIDGKRNSDYGRGFCSHTAENETNPWWRVDLQLTYVVTSVKITHRGDCCSERLDGAEIRIGNSLDNNGNNNPRCAFISNITAGKTYTYHCAEGNMEGRFVNVIIPGVRKTLTLCEVEVYAAPADLLAVYRVSAVTILNRGDCCSERLVGAEIRIGNSLSNYGNNNPRCAVISLGTLHYTFQCTDMEGRYVNVIIPGHQKILTLCAVEVYAAVAVPEAVTPLPPPPPPSVSMMLSGRNVTVVGARLCWSDALFYCRDHHWDLLSLGSQAEQRDLEGLLGHSPFPLTNHLWIGLRRYLMGDRWFWMSGDPMKYTKWKRGSAPQRYSSTCGSMANGEHFVWGHQLCEQLLNFICHSGAAGGVKRVDFYSTYRPKSL
uniref:uncharacterized protein n=1 Tax=Centroberyx gerrardi TaxID=166262 RepID=UPI003AB044D9